MLRCVMFRTAGLSVWCGDGDATAGPGWARPGWGESSAGRLSMKLTTPALPSFPPE